VARELDEAQLATAELQIGVRMKTWNAIRQLLFSEDPVRKIGRLNGTEEDELVEGAATVDAHGAAHYLLNALGFQNHWMRVPARYQNVYSCQPKFRAKFNLRGESGTEADERQGGETAKESSEAATKDSRHDCSDSPPTKKTINIDKLTGFYAGKTHSERAGAAGEALLGEEEGEAEEFDVNKAALGTALFTSVVPWDSMELGLRNKQV